MLTGGQIIALVILTEFIIYNITKMICNTVETNCVTETISELGYRLPADDFKKFINTLADIEKEKVKEE